MPGARPYPAMRTSPPQAPAGTHPGHRATHRKHPPRKRKAWATVSERPWALTGHPHTTHAEGKAVLAAWVNRSAPPAPADGKTCAAKSQKPNAPSSPTSITATPSTTCRGVTSCSTANPAATQMRRKRRSRGWRGCGERKMPRLLRALGGHSLFVPQTPTLINTRYSFCRKRRLGMGINGLAEAGKC